MSKKTIVYLAGPLRGNIIRKWANIYVAKKYARMLWHLGYIVYSPHLNSGWLDHPLTDKMVMTANIVLLGKCDCLVLMDGWEQSVGTLAEIRAANEMAMPVYHIADLVRHNG